jgi:hypothetical protein
VRETRLRSGFQSARAVPAHDRVSSQSPLSFRGLQNSAEIVCQIARAIEQTFTLPLAEVGKKSPLALSATTNKQPFQGVKR